MSDHLGSVRDLVDNNGNAVNHYIYDCFDNVVSKILKMQVLSKGDFKQDSELMLCIVFREQFFRLRIIPFI